MDNTCEVSNLANIFQRVFAAGKTDNSFVEGQKMAKTLKRRKRIGEGKPKVNQIKQNITEPGNVTSKVKGEGSRSDTIATSFETEEVGHPMPSTPQC